MVKAASPSEVEGASGDACLPRAHEHLYTEDGYAAGRVFSSSIVARSVTGGFAPAHAR
jgi:hypothetical protein